LYLHPFGVLRIRANTYICRDQLDHGWIHCATDARTHTNTPHDVGVVRGLELGIWLSNWTDIQAAHLDKFAGFVFAALGLSFNPNPSPLMSVHLKLIVWNTNLHHVQNCA